jgi:hypothetical protein
LLEDRKVMTKEKTKTVDKKIDKPPQIEALAIKNHISGQEALEHKSFYDLREVISSSPFKPKEKSLKRVIVGNDAEFTHDFSKPLNTSEVMIKLTKIRM